MLETRWTIILGTLVTLTLTAVPVFAHHGWRGYDTSKRLLAYF